MPGFLHRRCTSNHLTMQYCGQLRGCQTLTHQQVSQRRGGVREDFFQYPLQDLGAEGSIREWNLRGGHQGFDPVEARGQRQLRTVGSCGLPQLSAEHIAQRNEGLGAHRTHESAFVCLSRWPCTPLIFLRNRPTSRNPHQTNYPKKQTRQAKRGEPNRLETLM